MIPNIILISLFINWLFYLPVYQNIVRYYNLPKKPLLCEFCMTFWCSILLFLITFNTDWLIISITAPVLTVLVKRVIDALPISL